MSIGWQEIERMAAAHLGLLQVGLGCTIVAGGTGRMPPPTYDVLLDFTGGKAWPYGMLFILCGLVLGIPHPRAMLIGHCLGLCAYDLLAALFFIAMLRDPNAAATAWWAYFALGTVHGFNLSLMWLRRHGRHEHAAVPTKDGRSGT